MQACNKELAFLVDEQDKIRKQDWSDRMVDPPDIRRQYEVRTVQPKHWQILFLSMCYYGDGVAGPKWCQFSYDPTVETLIHTWKRSIINKWMSFICENEMDFYFFLSCCYFRFHVKTGEPLGKHWSHVIFWPNMLMTPLWFDLNQNFKNNSLLSHESEVNKLQEEGDRLIDMKHPATATIQVLPRRHCFQQ